MLWLCLHFPYLPLEIFSRTHAAEAPWVVSHGKGTRRHVLLCNKLAAARGIRAGMSLSAAYGLTQSLHVRGRDAAAEQQALEAVAAWAGQFTSLVSIAPPQSLLLEIKGSLTLFKGLSALLRRILGEIRELGYQCGFGVAPTPLGAWLLARAGITQPVMHVQDLSAALRDLPLRLLALDDKQTHTLQGLTSISSTIAVICYRPKSALRDVGKALGLDVNQLDRLSKSLAWTDWEKIKSERMREQGYDPGNPLIKRWLAISNTLVGFPRHLSQHVGGFVISNDHCRAWCRSRTRQWKIAR